eukprot:302789_1
MKLFRRSRSVASSDGYLNIGTNSNNPCRRASPRDVELQSMYTTNSSITVTAESLSEQHHSVSPDNSEISENSTSQFVDFSSRSSSPRGVKQRLRCHFPQAHRPLECMYIVRGGSSDFSELSPNGNFPSSPMIGLSPDESCVLMCFNNSRIIHIFDANQLDRVGILEYATPDETKFGGCVNALVPLPRHGLMLAAGFADSGIRADFSIRAFRLDCAENGARKVEATLVCRLIGHGGYVLSIKPSADGMFLSSIARDLKIILWDLRDVLCSSRDIKPFVADIPSTPTVNGVPHAYTLSAVSAEQTGASPTGPVGVRFAACACTNTLHLWLLGGKSSRLVEMVVIFPAGSGVIITSLEWGSHDSKTTLFILSNTGLLKGFDISCESESPYVVSTSFLYSFPITCSAFVIVRSGAFVLTTTGLINHAWSLGDLSRWVCEYVLDRPDSETHSKSDLPIIDNGSLGCGGQCFVCWSPQVGLTVWKLLQSFDRAGRDGKLFTKVSLELSRSDDQPMYV